MVAMIDLTRLINSQPEKGQLPQLKSTCGPAPNPWGSVFPILTGVGGFHLGTWGVGDSLF